MCGIAGFHLRRPCDVAATRFAQELLWAINSRGGDATGYAALTRTGEVQMQKASCGATKFIHNGMRPIPADAQTVLLHTRFATQGAPEFPENNHPVQTGSTYVVHNGIIWNDWELFNEMACRRMAEVDSEAIPAVIEDAGWDNAAKGLERLEGDYAIAAFNSERPGELILAKGAQSPLFFVVTDKLIAWASTKEALLTAWRSVIGTPPKRKVREVKTGEMVYVNGPKWRIIKFNAREDVKYSAAYVMPAGPKLMGFEPKLGDKLAAALRARPGQTTSTSRPFEDPEMCTECGSIFEGSELFWRHGTDDYVCTQCDDWAVTLAEEASDALIECPSCMDFFSIDQMDGAGDSLYCTGCWDAWQSQGRTPRALGPAH